METKQIVKQSVYEKLKLPTVQLSIGAGLHWKRPLELWINQDGVDNENIDLVSTWEHIPLPDRCVDVMELGDVIEHIRMFERDKILTEWFRMLKVGGSVRISTPNLHRTMVDYANGKLSLELAIQNIFAWMTNEYEYHYYCYTVETLTAVLTEYGFTEIDFSESPGVDGNSDKRMAWWLVCSAKLTHPKK